MDKKIKILQKINDDLKIVFLSAQLVDLIKTDQSFRKLIVKLISIKKAIESSDESQLNINNFKSETKNDFDKIDFDFSLLSIIEKLNKFAGFSQYYVKDFNYDISSLDDLNDEINYFDVFILNTTKKNVDEFKKEIIEKNQTLKSNNNGNENHDLGNKSKEGNSDDNSLNFKNWFSDDNKNDSVSVKEQVEMSKKIAEAGLISQIVSKRMSAEIKKNNFYFYNSKSKIIVILKFIIGGLFGFLSLLMLTLFISLIVAVSSNPSIQLPPIISKSDNDAFSYYDVKLLIPNLLAVGVASYLSFKNCYEYLYSAIGYGELPPFIDKKMPMPIARKLELKKKNLTKVDVVKYGFSSARVIFYMIIVVVLIAMLFPQFYIFLTMDNKLKDINSDYISLINCLFIITLTITAVAGCIIIATITSYIFSPKPDEEKIEKKRNEIIQDMISKGELPASSGSLF